MKNIINILDKLAYFLNKLSNHLNRDSGLQLVTTSFSTTGRFILFHFTNNHLKSHRDVLYEIYSSLMNNEAFTSFGKNKVIITTSVINNREYNFHPNVLLTNNTTFAEYFSDVIDHLNLYYDNDHYYSDDSHPLIDVIPSFRVRVWNMDVYLNEDIKINKNVSLKTQTQLIKSPAIRREYSTNSIKPFKNNIVSGISNPISTIDIETIDYLGNQIPVCISMAYLSQENKVIGKLFLIDHNLLLKNAELAVNKLWDEYIKYILSRHFKYVFAHNLGGFDGGFIYKSLSERFKPEFVRTIIDHHNKFINITLNIDSGKTIYLDSYRIFSVSLNELCKVFNVPSKTNTYKIEYNSFEVFNNPVLFKEFKTYAKQDSISLLNALLKAQEIYLRDFNIDITTIVSTSSLSLKIFRSRFLNVNIPILKGNVDHFIRRSYFGGGTDYYKSYAKKVKYYDVNSLYPHSMCKPMPHKIIKVHKNINIELTEDSNLFGETINELKERLRAREFKILHFLKPLTNTILKTPSSFGLSLGMKLHSDLNFNWNEYMKI